MKRKKPIPEPTKELKAKCDARDQHKNFDRLFRAVVSVPKLDALRREAKKKRQKHGKARR